MPIYKSNLRLVAMLDKENNIHIEFSNDIEDDHRDLYMTIIDKPYIVLNFDIPAYARFYSMLYGNSRYPQLIIYGDSSSYPIDKLEYHKDKYEKMLRDYVYINNWDILFLP